MSDDITEKSQDSSAQNQPKESLKKKAVQSVLWRIIETGGRQVVQLVISIILARLIMPDQFGAIAMLTIFTAVAWTFIDSGFSQALVRKNNRTQTDCSTVFYFNMAIAVILYIILYLCAPLVSRFYEMPILTSVLRVTALSLIISGFTAVQSALYTAKMDFKFLAKWNVISLIVSGTVGVVMAYLDFQVWALVAQALVGSAFTSACLWIKSSWRPTLTFSLKSLKEFFGFGSKLMASSLLDTAFSNIYGIVIGKVYNASDLAYYNRAGSLSRLTTSMPTSVLQSVTYPTLCKIQDDDERLRNGYRHILRLCSFVIFPLCLGIGAVSYPLVNVLYTDKWIYAAALLQIIVFSGMWYPVHAINLNLLIVKGRSDLFLRLEILKKIVTVLTLCITVPFGIEVMCYGNVVNCFIALYLNTYYTGKLLNMGLMKQMKDYLPFFTLSIGMFVVCKIITFVMGNGLISLITGICSGIVIYIGGTLIFQFPEYKELLLIIRRKL